MNTGTHSRVTAAMSGMSMRIRLSSTAIGRTSAVVPRTNVML